MTNIILKIIGDMGTVNYLYTHMYYCVRLLAMGPHKDVTDNSNNEHLSELCSSVKSTNKVLEDICSVLKQLSLEIKRSNDLTQSMMTSTLTETRNNVNSIVPRTCKVANNETCNKYGSQLTSHVTIENSSSPDGSVDNISNRTIEYGNSKSEIEDNNSSMSMIAGVQMSSIKALEHTNISLNNVMQGRNRPVRNIQDIPVSQSGKKITEKSLLSEYIDDTAKGIMIKSLLNKRSLAISFVFTGILHNIYDNASSSCKLKPCGFDEALKYIETIVFSILTIESNSIRKTVVDSMGNYIVKSIVELKSDSGEPTEYRITAPTYRNMSENMKSTDLLSRLFTCTCKCISRLPLLFHYNLCAIANVIADTDDLIIEEESSYVYNIDETKLKQAVEKYKKICNVRPDSTYINKESIYKKIKDSLAKKLHRDLFIKLLCQLTITSSVVDEKFNEKIPMKRLYSFMVILCHDDLKLERFSGLSSNLELSHRYTLSDLVRQVIEGKIKCNNILYCLEYSCEILLQMNDITPESKNAIDIYTDYLANGKRFIF